MSAVDTSTAATSVRPPAAATRLGRVEILFALAAVAAANAVSHGPDLAKRELAGQILAREGLSIQLPPAPGFDWAGTITPAAFAVPLVVVIVVLVRATRARRA
jgi:hypothetical protein